MRILARNRCSTSFGCRVDLASSEQGTTLTVVLHRGIPNEGIFPRRRQLHARNCPSTRPVPQAVGAKQHLRDEFISFHYCLRCIHQSARMKSSTALAVLILMQPVLYRASTKWKPSLSRSRIPSAAMVGVLPMHHRASRWLGNGSVMTSERTTDVQSSRISSLKPTESAVSTSPCLGIDPRSSAPEPS